MRVLVLFAVVACSPLVVAAANAQSNAAIDVCLDGAPQERVVACGEIASWPGLPPEMRAAAHLNRGVGYAEMREFERAIIEYDQALALNPNYFLAFYDRGQARRYSGQMEAALADYEMALSLNPSAANAQNQVCWARVVIERDLAGAISICDSAVAAAPGDPLALDSRALLRTKIRDYDGAISDYDAALVVSTENLTHLRYGRGIALIRAGRTAEGQREIETALAADPEIANTYVGFGISAPHR